MNNHEYEDGMRRSESRSRSKRNVHFNDQQINNQIKERESQNGLIKSESEKKDGVIDLDKERKEHLALIESQ